MGICMHFACEEMKARHFHTEACEFAMKDVREWWQLPIMPPCAHTFSHEKKSEIAMNVEWEWWQLPKMPSMNCEDNGKNNQKQAGNAHLLHGMCRGGALGSHVTARSRNTREILQHLHELVDSFEDEGEQKTEMTAVDHLKALIAKWGKNPPIKTEAIEELKDVIRKLSKHAEVEDTKELRMWRSKDKVSFYGPPSLAAADQRELATQPTKSLNGKSQGKGKGKKVEKGKGPWSSLPRFDLARIWPSKSIASWQTIAEKLERGQPPIAAAAICDSQERILELQALAAAHQITSDVVLVSKYDENAVEVEGAIVTLLPFAGNIASSLRCQVGWKQTQSGG